MCGICGFVSKNRITREQLTAMNNTMVHRGPDDAGAEIYEGKNGYAIGFAQRRLSILDLSVLGHQPMHSLDKRVSIVYNGEIYNFQEIKEELRDYSFQSECDTEVILAAYLKWGIDCVKRFNGMFAIAIYDRETEEVFLIRDRIGKKPLYYWERDDNLVFASELKSIMNCPGFEKKIRTEILARYLCQQYINAPDSIFVNVRKLEPGSILRFAGGRITTWKYWDIAEVYGKQKLSSIKDYGQAKQELKELLKRAVKLRMIADVPLGSFLSGGYDSSLITAIAQEHSVEPVKTFSIGFYEERYNEAEYAQKIASHLGTKHTELYVSEKEMFAMVEDISKYYDEPFADSSQIPSMLVAKLAKKDVTVVLSGDGGDEFFCGYNIYQSVRQAQKLDLFGEVIFRICNLPGFKQIHMEEKMPLKVRTIVRNRDKETKTQFISDNYIHAAKQMILQEQMPIYYACESKYHEKDWQKRRMLLDMDTYLPGDILCKVDRATMKYSLEARCPILDKDVMEYSYRLPQTFKYDKGIKKRILKDIAYDYIPKELLERPKKGFSVPLDKWLRGPLREQLLAYSESEYIKKQGIFNAEYLDMLTKRFLQRGDKGAGTGANYSRIVWAFLVFQKWYETL